MRPEKAIKSQGDRGTNFMSECCQT